MFVWKVCQNALPVLANMAKKRLSKTHICPICLKETETIEHLLLLCPWTEPIWFGFQIINALNPHSVQNMASWLENQSFKDNTEGSDVHKSMLLYALWTIRKSRNDCVLEQETEPYGSDDCCKNSES